MSDETRNYWWLNANPAIWNFSEYAPGEENDYTQFNENGRPRKIQRYFSQVCPGDLVLGYATSPKQEIVCLCKITRPLEDGAFHFTKVLDFPNPVPSSDWTTDPQLTHSHFQGSLFKLTQEQWDGFIRLVKERNPGLSIPQGTSFVESLPTIWKIAHGSKEFNPAQDVLDYLASNNLVTMHRKTGKGQGAKFISEMKVGDYFYLREAGKIKLFGRIESGAEFKPDPVNKYFGDQEGNWVARKYSILFKAISDVPYAGPQRVWTPNYNSTLGRIPEDSFSEFEKLILLPYFGKTLRDLFGKQPLSPRDKILRALFVEMQGPKFREWIDGWHEKYQMFCEQVARAPNIDDGLLHALLWEKWNGVSVVGQSILKRDFYDTLASSSEFRDTLEAFHQHPDKAHFSTLVALTDSMAEKANHRKFHLRLNRIAATFNTELSSIPNEVAFAEVLEWLKTNDLLDFAPTGDWFSDNLHLTQSLTAVLADVHGYDIWERNMFLWWLYETYAASNLSPSTETNSMNDTTSTPVPVAPSLLNAILFGPPGTGKTRDVINHVLAIIDGVDVPDKQTAKEYAQAKARFDELKAQGRVAFVTFHQSYGYEDFIEGIRPVLDDESGAVAYELHDGIFKAFCKNAQSSREDKTGFDAAYARFVDDIEEAPAPVELKSPRGTPFRVSLNNRGNLNLYTGNGRKIQGTLTKEKISRYFSGEGEFPYWKSYYGGVVNHLKAQYGLPTLMEEAHGVAAELPYVFVIDEINRGNISKIFGELITLVEPSKRLGAKEETRAVLPYSGEEFGVPPNVYILGTMNTADRSIALLDTALRRRFEFIEMMPRPELLRGVRVLGEKGKDLHIDLEKMLQAMNERIEFLLDREHAIGHAYFLPAVRDNILDGAVFTEIFLKRIVPLLQEYFYEDYAKIRLVLGDALFKRKAKDIQFVTEEKGLAKKLFPGVPDDFGGPVDEERVLYRINEEAFEYADAYIGIYGVVPERVEEVEKSSEAGE